jgi:hypothetical protein
MMATFFHHECDRCGLSFSTSGPHEFFRTGTNRGVVDYGHPVASSPEAKAAGVFGFYAKAFCVHCGKNFDVVVREFERPVGRHDGIWMPGVHPEKRVTAICPECGDVPVWGYAPAACECGGTIHCTVTGGS